MAVERDDHTPRLTIDLGAVASNYQALRSEIKNGAIVSGVVKADAYGLGADKVAARLARAGCRVFFTAYLSEAQHIIPVLPMDAIIYVLNGFKPVPCDARIIPVISTGADLAVWRDDGRAIGLQIDTGMHRLGLTTADAQTAAGMDVRLIMSHLACADAPQDNMNARQLAAFHSALAILRPLFPDAKASLANSAGVFLGPDYHFDLVRPGIALYGGIPCDFDALRKENPLRHVVTAESRILHIHSIDRGDTVGYGATYRADRTAKIATIGLGYADGYLRAQSGKGVMIADGKRCAVVGRVSMDLVTLDITGCTAEVGDWVTVYGGDISVSAAAETAGTIDYEILTALGARYRRTYLDE